MRVITNCSIVRRATDACDHEVLIMAAPAPAPIYLRAAGPPGYAMFLSKTTKNKYILFPDA